MTPIFAAAKKRNAASFFTWKFYVAFVPHKSRELKKMRLILDQNRNSLEKLFGKLRANAEKCDYAELCVTFKHWYVCKL